MIYLTNNMIPLKKIGLKGHWRMLCWSSHQNLKFRNYNCSVFKLKNSSLTLNGFSSPFGLVSKETCFQQEHYSTLQDRVEVICCTTRWGIQWAQLRQQILPFLFTVFAPRVTCPVPSWLLRQVQQLEWSRTFKLKCGTDKHLHLKIMWDDKNTRNPDAILLSFKVWLLWCRAVDIAKRMLCGNLNHINLNCMLKKKGRSVSTQTDSFKRIISQHINAPKRHCNHPTSNVHLTQVPWYLVPIAWCCAVHPLIFRLCSGTLIFRLNIALILHA